MDGPSEILDSLAMRRGFWVGIVAGVVVSLGLGLTIALLPSTPTWALWRLTRAIDQHNTDEITALIDIPAVASRALAEFSSGQARTREGLDLGDLALALMAGGQVRTVFDDPRNRIRITPQEFLEAWWHMRREGQLAYLTIDAAGQDIDLILQKGPHLRWRIAGITPLAALLRVDRH
ncbi:MAG: hypothetical protein VCC00_11870 [Deltaproteobacteria bacterium]